MVQAKMTLKRQLSIYTPNTKLNRTPFCGLEEETCGQTDMTFPLYKKRIKTCSKSRNWSLHFATVNKMSL